MEAKKLVGTLAVTLCLLTACGRQDQGKAASSAEPKAGSAESVSPEPQFLSACLGVPTPWGLQRLGGGISVQDLVQILQQGGAKVNWEKSADGAILRRIVNDQLTNKTSNLAIALTAAKPAATAEPTCGPGSVAASRAVLDEREMEQGEILVWLSELTKPTMVQHLAARGASELSGEYTLAGDNGEEGDVTITRSSATSYKVSVSTGREGCAGSAEGPAVLKDRTLVVSARAEYGDEVCSIEITPKGAELLVDEGAGCQPFHGAMCSLSGVAKRK